MKKIGLFLVCVLLVGMLPMPAFATEKDMSYYTAFHGVTISQIQTFLDNHSGDLKDQDLKSRFALDPENSACNSSITTPQIQVDEEGNSRAAQLSPAEIIYYAARENDCNVVIILATMQKEQSLISNPASQGRLNCATGYLGTGERFKSFLGQLVANSYQWQQYYKSGLSFRGAYNRYTPPSVYSNMAYEDFVVKLYQPYANEMQNIMEQDNKPVIPRIVADQTAFTVQKGEVVTLAGTATSDRPILKITMEVDDETDEAIPQLDASFAPKEEQFSLDHFQIDTSYLTAGEDYLIRIWATTETYSAQGAGPQAQIKLTLQKDPDVPSFLDIQSEREAKMLAVLGLLDVVNGYDDGNFYPQSNITRGEFAVLITRFLGVQQKNLPSKITNGFTDVPKDHWAAKYIEYVVQAKIVNGYDDKLFGPEDVITTEQSIKMIVCAMGYQQRAEQRGGYPEGYAWVAENLGIIAGRPLTPKQPATRIDAAGLMFGALEVPYNGKNKGKTPQQILQALQKAN